MKFNLELNCLFNEINLLPILKSFYKPSFATTEGDILVDDFTKKLIHKFTFYLPSRSCEYYNNCLYVNDGKLTYVYTLYDYILINETLDDLYMNYQFYKHGLLYLNDETSDKIEFYNLRFENIGFCYKSYCLNMQIITSGNSKYLILHDFYNKTQNRCTYHIQKLDLILTDMKIDFIPVACRTIDENSFIDDDRIVIIHDTQLQIFNISTKKVERNKYVNMSDELCYINNKYIVICSIDKQSISRRSINESHDIIFPTDYKILIYLKEDLSLLHELPLIYKIIKITLEDDVCKLDVSDEGRIIIYEYDIVNKKFI